MPISIMYRRKIKPVLDFIFSLTILILVLPVFVLITLLLSIFSNGKPFFVQIRPGKDEKPFKLIKFKTMNDLKDAEGKLLPDAKRLNALGKFLRTTSMDELPQLLNVIKGDMSIVGPRPLLMEYLPLYNLIQRRRHEVKPGITGWAQVNGRNTISWKEKFEHDIYYVKHLSFNLDLIILLKTFEKVLNRKGVNQNEQTTMEFFNGNDN